MMISNSHVRAAAVALALAAAVATTTPAAHAAPSVTVYSNDLAFVRDARTYDLGAAHDTLVIDDLPQRLDLALGREVRVVLRGDRMVEGTLLSADGGWLVVQERDGSLHTLARGSADDLRVTSTTAPFTLRPTVEVVVDGAHRGSQQAELSYLTGGLSWSAEHTVVRRGETEAEWSTAVTIDNLSGIDYPDAEIKLVAGNLNRTGPTPLPYAKGGAQMTLQAAAAESDMSQESFADYHLYALSRPATLRERESQKLTMLEPRDVKVTPRYLYRGWGGQVAVQLRIENDKASGLGVPLPGGRVRFYEADAAGELQFTGETRIGHTAEDEEMTLDVGTAFDLVAERRELYNKRIADREREYAVEIKLRNRKKRAVEIVVQERVSGDVTITQKSHDFERKDANTLEFVIPVPAGKEVIVSYTAHVRY